MSPKIPYPISTIIVPSNHLNILPQLPELAAVLNRSYTHCHLHGAGYEIFPPDVGRLGKPEDLESEIGPDGFCVIAFSSAHDRIIASASAKPYHIGKAEGASGEANMMFKRPAVATILAEDEEALPMWELLAMAVDPDLQGKGISNQLLDVTLEEIKIRVAEKATCKNGIKILISVAKEINEGYYLKKGWETTQERLYPAGSAGNTSKFTVLDMVKVV